ncbi:MAG: hypothetical protein K5683_05400 [Prevotella sp.]|nr:hypothetical protein [Prevotella sp.]
MLLLISGKCVSQDVREVVVADADTHQPVAHASLYTKEAGSFHSCISNEQGKARIGFHFQRLTVSHLNYEKRTFRKLADTLFLQPRYLSKAEVIVTNKEPEWIRRCLKQVVRLKQQNYFSHEANESFVYDTQSMGTDNIYRFHCTGLLRTRDTHHKQYAILLDSAQIIASDSTRLTDMTNLRRMLYEDFVANLDNSFIRSHRFFHNADYQGISSNEVELRFRSKHETDDRGWIVLDTARCIILGAQRVTGTKTNRQELIEGIMYAMARVFGYRIDTWTRDYHVSYALRDNGTLYPAEIRYKMYFAGHDSEDQRQKEFNDQTGGGFPNMEATLRLSTCSESPSGYDQWLELPASWYIRFNTDDDRQKEILLSNLPATFSIFENEP